MHYVVINKWVSYIQDPVGTVKTLARFLNIECGDSFAEDIAEKCNFKNLKHASENIKFDHINNSKPNPEFENPGVMYRKGQYNELFSIFLSTIILTHSHVVLCHGVYFQVS